MAPTSDYTRDTPAFIGFQPEPAGRGTKGIIWTCLSTILLSSWSSWHGWAYDPNKTFWREARRSYVFKFVGAFLLPEAGAVESFENLCDALQLRKAVRRVGRPEFANFSLTQAFIFVKCGVSSRPPGSGELEWVFPETLVKLVSSRSLSFSDLPTDDEIADKSKRDWTLKSLSIIQTLWFIVSSIARLSRGYPVSLYEDITLANAFCGVIEFACWFHCPQDIRLPFIITPNVPAASKTLSAAESEEPTEEATIEALLVSEYAIRKEASSGPQVSVTEDMRTGRWSMEFPSSERSSFTQKRAKRRASFATQTVEFTETSREVSIVVLAVFSIFFASIHIAAWNYSFASATEAWIWRGGSLALAVLGVFMSLCWSQREEGVSIFNLESTWDFVFFFIFGLYESVRLMMLVVALMSFRKAPARLYETPSWTQYWPHI